MSMFNPFNLSRSATPAMDEGTNNNDNPVPSTSAAPGTTDHTTDPPELTSASEEETNANDTAVQRSKTTAKRIHISSDSWKKFFRSLDNQEKGQYHIDAIARYAQSVVNLLENIKEETAHITPISKRIEHIAEIHATAEATLQKFVHHKQLFYKMVKPEDLEPYKKDYEDHHQALDDLCLSTQGFIDRLNAENVSALLSSKRRSRSHSRHHKDKRTSRRSKTAPTDKAATTSTKDTSKPKKATKETNPDNPTAAAKQNVPKEKSNSTVPPTKTGAGGGPPDDDPDDSNSSNIFRTHF